jgi:hypothetical protein
MSQMEVSQVVNFFVPFCPGICGRREHGFAPREELQRGDFGSLFAAGIPDLPGPQSGGSVGDAKAARAGAAPPNPPVCGCRRKKSQITLLGRHWQTLARAYAAPASGGPPPPALARDSLPAPQGTRLRAAPVWVGPSEPSLLESQRQSLSAPISEAMKATVASRYHHQVSHQSKTQQSASIKRSEASFPQQQD